jgi:hypothetical protein
MGTRRWADFNARLDLFREHSKKYESSVSAKIKAAGPV